MKANMLKKSLLTGAVIAAVASISTSTQAADGTFGFKFTTVPDVSIAPDIPLSFGADLVLSASSTCTLVLDATTGKPSNVDARQGIGAASAAGANFQSRTGNCDNTQKGTAGRYIITGAQGVDVNITVNPILPGAGDFSFVPEALAVDNAAGADNDLLEVLIANGQAREGAVRLASTTDTGVSGSPIPGQTYLYVAGTLTAQNQLTAGTTYSSQTFVVDVVY